MSTIDEPRSDLTLAARWRQNRLDVEAGRHPVFPLTPAQVAAVKSSIGFPRGNGASRRYPGVSVSLLPLSSGRSVKPGVVEPICARIDNGASGTDAWFPEQALFSRETLDSFAIEAVSLHPWKEPPRVLLARERDGRIDVAMLDRFLRQVALPACDLEIVVRNVDDAPRVFCCSILYYERSADLSAESEEEARRIDASPVALRRRDARVAAALARR